MIKPPPQIDARTASEIAEQVRGLLREYAPEWQPQDPLTGERDQLAAALIAIFARYSEIIIQRLNQAPQKNLLAFLDLLGAAPMPPQPARVPLTFIPAAGAVVDGVVPPGTQVASPPGEGEADPVIFETERELVVTAATLDALFVVEPDHDRYGDRRALLVVNDPDQRTLTVVNTEGQPLFEAETAIDHILYLGDRDFFSLSNLANVSLSMTFKKNVADEMVIHWERWDGTNWILMAKETTTANDPKQTVTFGALPVFPLSEVRV